MGTHHYNKASDDRSRRYGACYSTGMVDSLKLYEILTSAHLSEPQARAIVRAIEDAFEENSSRQAKVLAEKVDAAKFETEIIRTETSVEHKLLGFRNELTGLEVKIEQTKSELLRWMFVCWIGQVAATFAMIKLVK